MYVHAYIHTHIYPHTHKHTHKHTHPRIGTPQSRQDSLSGNRLSVGPSSLYGAAGSMISHFPLKGSNEMGQGREEKERGLRPLCLCLPWPWLFGQPFLCDTTAGWEDDTDLVGRLGTGCITEICQHVCVCVYTYI